MDNWHALGQQRLQKSAASLLLGPFAQFEDVKELARALHRAELRSSPSGQDAVIERLACKILVAFSSSIGSHWPIKYHQTIKASPRVCFATVQAEGPRH